MTNKPSAPLVQALVAIFIAAYLGRLAISGKPLDLAVLGTAGLATTLAGAFLSLLDNWLWRAPMFGKVLTSRPDIRALWHGQLSSTWTDEAGNDVPKCRRR